MAVVNKFPTVVFLHVFPCWDMVRLRSCFSFWFAWLDSFCCSASKQSRNISVKFLFFSVGSGFLLFRITVIHGKDGRWSVISFTKIPLFLPINCKYIVCDCGWMCRNSTFYIVIMGYTYCINSFGEIIYYWFLFWVKQVHVKITTYKFDILLSLCIHFNLTTPWTWLRHKLGPGKHSLSWSFCSCSYQPRQLCIHKHSPQSICRLRCTLIFPLLHFLFWLCLFVWFNLYPENSEIAIINGLLLRPWSYLCSVCSVCLCVRSSLLFIFVFWVQVDACLRLQQLCQSCLGWRAQVDWFPRQSAADLNWNPSRPNPELNLAVASCCDVVLILCSFPVVVGLICYKYSCTVP